MLEIKMFCPAMLFRSSSPWANHFPSLHSESSFVTHVFPAVYLTQFSFTVNITDMAVTNLI